MNGEHKLIAVIVIAVMLFLAALFFAAMQSDKNHADEFKTCLEVNSVQDCEAQIYGRVQ